MPVRGQAGLKQESSRLDDPHRIEGEEIPSLEDTPTDVSAPDVSLKPFVRALLALALELESRKEHCR